MQKEKINICPTCGAENDIYSSSCVECQRILSEAVRLPKSLSYTPSFNVIENVSKNDAQKKPSLKSFMNMFTILIVLLFITIPWFWLVSNRHGIGNTGNATNGLGEFNASGLGEFKASNGQLLGVNDGSFAPFLLGPDGQLKQQAVAQLKQKHASQAISLWSAALHITNNDAEAWIYLENQSVLLSGLPYITLVVGTDLFEPLGSNLSALRGVYVAQHEFNNGNHGFKLRLLIANSGTDTTNVSVITQQIVNIAKHDKTVVGVVSWLTSNENIIALPNLSNAHIPMISPLAASDQLTNASPYFFRIIAPNQIQGKQSALFVEQTLHAKKVVIFVDNTDSYSQNVAQVFEDQFRNDGNTILKVEPFTTDKTSTIKSLIQDALATKPDLLFFTGRDVSDAANFQDALPTSGPFAQLPALAGDSGYVIHKAGYGRWYFDADAFPDELNNVVGNSFPQSPFYQDYSNAFNEDGRKPAGYYGYTRPDSYAMLSYDVTSVFLNAIETVVANNKITLTTNGLQYITPTILVQTLPHVALQGVSGWIAFDSMGNPVNKAIVFLATSPDGHMYMKDWQGCFTKDLCHNMG
jgi:eukaryotic-like serine/threonine-protein kinase